MGNITIEQITIYLLMFADDAVLISDSKDGLQNLLVQFEIYCNKWQLTVNVEKTNKQKNKNNKKTKTKTKTNKQKTKKKTPQKKNKKKKKKKKKKDYDFSKG